MNYNLIITKRAQALLDHILYYIMNQSKDPETAKMLMNELSHVYDNLEYNPKMYTYAKDTYLKSRGYRKVVVLQYDYVIIFRIEEESKSVYIAGFFYNLESYKNKL